MSDVIVLKEATPETADVVAPLDARYAHDSPRAMVALSTRGVTNLKEKGN